MKINQIYPKIYHVTTKELSVLGLTFCRMQEYYESANPKYKGHIFDLDEFIGWFKEEYDTDYLTEWEGYNLSGKLIKEVINNPEFTKSLSIHESWFINELKFIPNLEKCY